MQDALLPTASQDHLVLERGGLRGMPAQLQLHATGQDRAYIGGHIVVDHGRLDGVIDKDKIFSGSPIEVERQIEAVVDQDSLHAEVGVHALLPAQIRIRRIVGAIDLHPLTVEHEITCFIVGR